ncbi:MAG: DUF4390 domain-containing protein [Betaproteobacteria bacterium]|nr:DUF4390 domain-containing protein [Betaproteobacteria bacterium]
MLLLGFIGLLPFTAHAEGAAIQTATLEATDEGYQLNADIDLQLTLAMQEAVKKGIPLYFILEFEISQDRWYWLDKSIVSERRERRISYTPLTEQYRVSLAGISQNLSTFDDVRRLLSRVRSWTVAEKGKLKAGEKYEAALRFRLDTARLPKPFQINIITSKDWNLTTDWYRWRFTAGAEK